MSHQSQGVLFKTPSGKFVRTYRARTHLGTSTYVQATPDIYCATVFYGGRDRDEQKVRDLAHAEFGELTEVQVEITRTITILQEGNQPCLPL